MAKGQYQCTVCGGSSDSPQALVGHAGTHQKEQEERVSAEPSAAKDEGGERSPPE